MTTQLCENGTGADAPEAADTGEAPPAYRGRGAVTAVAAGLCAAALAALAFLVWQNQQQEAVGNASRAALAAAQDYAVTLTSIDTGSVDDNFAKVMDGATGEFKDMYGQSATQLRQLLIDNKAMSTGVVVDAAVKAATKDNVEVLLFVDQSITNVANPAPRLDRSRVTMTMQLTDGRWLASRVELK